MGNKEIGDKVKEEISKFLDTELKLKLSPTKTKITNLKIRPARFLGFSIKSYNKRRLTLSKFGEFTKRAGWDIIVDVNMDRIVDRRILKGFINKNKKPTAKRAWSVLKEEQIITNYNYIIRSLGNYYFPMIDRYGYLNSILYLLKFSCLSTFAKKYNSKITKITQKFEDPLKIKVIEKYTQNKEEKAQKETAKEFVLLTYPRLKELLKPQKFNWKQRHFL